MEVSSGNWRTVATWVSLMAVVLGMVITDVNNAVALAAGAAVAFALVACHTDFTIMWVLTAAIVLVLSPMFVAAAHASDGGVVAGYILLICGIWTPVLVQTPSNVGAQAKNSLSHMFSLAGLLFVFVAFIAAILLWTKVEENNPATGGLLAAGFDLLIISVLFLRAIWWNDLIWKRISLFWFSYYQTSLLASGLDATGVLKAGFIMGWICVIAFIILLLVDGEVQVSLDTGKASSLSFILIALWFVLAVVGAGLMHDKASDGMRWMNAVGILAIVCLAASVLCTPETGSSLFQTSAVALTLSVIGPILEIARAFGKASLDQETAGAALMILGICLSFLCLPGFFSAKYGEPLALLSTDRLAQMATFGLLIHIAGIAAWGVYADDKAAALPGGGSNSGSGGGGGYGGYGYYTDHDSGLPTDLADLLQGLQEMMAGAGLNSSITALLSDVALIGVVCFNLVFFIVAFFYNRAWCLLNLFTSMFIMVPVMMQVSNKAVEQQAGGVKHATVGQMGTAFVWIGLIAFVLCNLAVLPRDHNRAAEEGVGGTGAAQDQEQAGPGRLSEPFDPEEQQQKDYDDYDEENPQQEEGEEEDAYHGEDAGEAEDMGAEESLHSE